MFQAALSPGNQSQDLGLTSLALDLILFSYVFINPFPPQSYVLPDLPPFGLLFPQSSFAVIPRFMGPASQPPKHQLCLLFLCPLCLTASSLCAARGEHLCSSSPSSSVFLGWPQITALSLSYTLTICMLCNFLCLRCCVRKTETNLEHLLQRI